MTELAGAAPQVRDIGSGAVTDARQRVIMEAAHALLTISEPEELVSKLFDKLSAILDVDAYFNYLLPPGSDRMVLQGCAGAPPEIEKVLQELEVGSAVCGMVALNRESMVVERVQEREDQMTELIRDLGIQAYACFPLLNEDDLIGTLSVGSRKRDRFHEDELELVGAIANLAAVSFHRRRIRMEREELLLRESELRERAESANRTKDSFLAMISHELRTPMTTALGWAQMLRMMDGTSPDQRRAAEEIERSLQRQRRLVQDLLEVSKLSTGKLHVERRDGQLFEVVVHAVESLRPSFEERGITLAVELASEGCPPLAIDSQRIEQVVGNLVGNAMKFTPEGGEVVVRLIATDAEARVEVRDSGVGMPPELLSTIFDPFVQASNRNGAGMGLGLAIARGLVEAHGGTIAAGSDGEGKGSTFWFSLPLELGESD